MFALTHWPVMCMRRLWGIVRGPWATSGGATTTWHWISICTRSMVRAMRMPQLVPHLLDHCSWTQTCIHIQAYNTCVHTICIYRYIPYVYRYIHTHMHTCIHTICMYIYIPYVYLYTHTYIHTYIYSYIQTCIHTYIHAHILQDRSCHCPKEHRHSKLQTKPIR